MREEIERPNELLPGVEFKIKELSSPSFLSLFPSATKSKDSDQIDSSDVMRLSSTLIELSTMSPQAWGFAFEKFLRDLFAVYNLAPKASFRIAGEQIDGIFELNTETYLLEAKWQNEPIGVSDLYTFAGKINSKASWTRGLFVSQSAFSEEGLMAFSRNRTSIVLMDGFDIYDALHRNIPFDQVIARKVRKAAETGNAFSRVRDLFPS